MNRHRIDEIKIMYPPGTRLKLILMKDPNAVTPGTKGTVRNVDDIGTIHVLWDNGRQLGVIPGEDDFLIISS